MDTTDAWIQERTGIRERRHIVKGSGDTTFTMGVKASKIAIERAGITSKEIDLILFATLSPDYYFPGSGVLVQDALDIPDCPAMDIRMQCSGFIYAVATADQFIKTGMYKNVLVIGSEYHSGGLEMNTRGRNISVIFGDGAAANIGSKATNDTRVAMTIGTSAAMRIVVNDIQFEGIEIPSGLWCYKINRTYSLLGGALTDGGSIYEWLQKTVKLDSNNSKNLEEYVNQNGNEKRLFHHNLTILEILERY